jgi:hypothetical protein
MAIHRRYAWEQAAVGLTGVVLGVMLETSFDDWRLVAGGLVLGLSAVAVIATSNRQVPQDDAERPWRDENLRFRDAIQRFSTLLRSAYLKHRGGEGPPGWDHASPARPPQSS